MPVSPIEPREAYGFRYIAEGPASELPPVVLLHGMLGDLSNWTKTIHALAQQQYRVIVPVLPVYDLPIRQTSVSGLTEFVHAFFRALKIDRAVLVGNSLGGHVALLYALTYPDAVEALILSGASGIYEVTTGTSTPRRHDREFVRERAAFTFYDPSHATDELVDEMCAIVNDRSRVARLIKMARSAKHEIVTERLGDIEAPTLLVWGRDDTITPPQVAEEFYDRLRDARLVFLDRCGHAPMIERPEAFNRLMLQFLRQIIGTPDLAVSDAHR